MMTVQQISQSAKTLLIAYFLQIKLEDEQIKKKVADLFLPAITVVIRSTYYWKQTNVLKHLLVIVGRCVFVYQKSETLFGKGPSGEKAADQFCDAIFSPISTLVVELLEGEFKRSKRTVDRILHSVFADDLSCDIGDKIIKYRKTRVKKEKEKLKVEIALLLVDYNEINNTNLTFDDILKRG